MKEGALIGSTDGDLFHLAVAQRRVIVTHDRDFGELSIARPDPFVGLIYLRPGHILSEFTIESFEVLLRVDPLLEPPFILVLERSANRIRIRLRHLS